MTNINTIGNLVGNLLLGSLPSALPQPTAPSPLNAAVTELRRRGLSVAPADGIPGLWNVSGHREMTTNQLLSLAGL